MSDPAAFGHPRGARTVPVGMPHRSAHVQSTSDRLDCRLSRPSELRIDRVAPRRLSLVCCFFGRRAANPAVTPTLTHHPATTLEPASLSPRLSDIRSAGAHGRREALSPVISVARSTPYVPCPFSCPSRRSRSLSAQKPRMMLPSARPSRWRAHLINRRLRPTVPSSTIDWAAECSAGRSLLRYWHLLRARKLSISASRHVQSHPRQSNRRSRGRPQQGRAARRVLSTKDSSLSTIGRQITNA